MIFQVLPLYLAVKNWWDVSNRKEVFRDDISYSIAFKAQRVLFLANKFDIYGDFRTFALIK